MCLSCGFAGRALQGGSGETAWACPRCGADLYARPPRSYAEMEGLSDSSHAGPAPARPERPELVDARPSIRNMTARFRLGLIGLALLTLLLVLGQAL